MRRNRFECKEGNSVLICLWGFQKQEARKNLGESLSYFFLFCRSLSLSIIDMIVIPTVLNLGWFVTMRKRRGEGKKE
jgi:hypothetical protein